MPIGKIIEPVGEIGHSRAGLRTLDIADSAFYAFDVFVRLHRLVGGNLHTVKKSVSTRTGNKLIKIEVC